MDECEEVFGSSAHENLIVTGQTGTGKSWLACAIGRQAARLDHSVLYVRAPRLFEDLALARLDGRFPRLIDKLTRVQVPPKSAVHHQCERYN